MIYPLEIIGLNTAAGSNMNGALISIKAWTFPINHSFQEPYCEANAPLTNMAKSGIEFVCKWDKLKKRLMLKFGIFIVYKNIDKY